MHFAGNREQPMVSMCLPDSPERWAVGLVWGKPGSRCPRAGRLDYRATLNRGKTRVEPFCRCEVDVQPPEEEEQEEE